MKVDDFESVFRSSFHHRFRYQRPPLQKVLFLGKDSEAEAIQYQINDWLQHTGPSEQKTTQWSHCFESQDLAAMLNAAESVRPDLMVAQRGLGLSHTTGYSLGSYIDTLTQAVDTPLLLLPKDTTSPFASPTSLSILVVQNKMEADDRLSSWGVRLCPKEGELHVGYVEDNETFARYDRLIGMIPNIDTESARQYLTEKILARAQAYVASITDYLEGENFVIKVQSHIAISEPLTFHQSIINERGVGLVIMNTKDHGQRAMASLPYAIAVEMPRIPMLLL